MNEFRVVAGQIAVVILGVQAMVAVLWWAGKKMVEQETGVKVRIGVKPFVDDYDYLDDPMRLADLGLTDEAMDAVETFQRDCESCRVVAACTIVCLDGDLFEVCDDCERVAR